MLGEPPIVSEVAVRGRLEPRLQELVQLEVTRAAPSMPAAPLSGCGKSRPLNQVYFSHRGDDPGISQSLCSLPVHASSGVRLLAASKCACFSFAQLQGALSCDRGPSTQFRVAWSCTSAWRTQLEPSRTAPLLLSAALKHLEPQPRLRLGVRRLQLSGPRCCCCLHLLEDGGDAPPHHARFRHSPPSHSRTLGSPTQAAQLGL